jgi:hypothetical protein
MSIHGAIVIQNAPLLIGQLSEQAAEARNKYFHLSRHNFARKFSRVSCTLDVLNRLLLSSDPVITVVSHTNSDREDSHDDKSSEELQVSSDDET